MKIFNADFERLNKNIKIEIQIFYSQKKASFQKANNGGVD